MKSLVILLASAFVSTAAVAYDPYYDGYNPYGNSGYNGYNNNYYGNGYRGYPPVHYGNDDGGYYVRNGGRDAFITTPKPDAAKLPDPFEKFGE